MGASTRLLCMVKANAYGHGAVPVARALESAGADMFGVAVVGEGVELREAGVRGGVLVLGGVYGDDWSVLRRHDLTPVIFEAGQLPRLEAAGVRRFHLKVDTGLSRLGVRWDQLEDFLNALKGFPSLEVEGVCSHFANADLSDEELTRVQVRRFEESVALLARRGISPRFVHLANSAAAGRFPAARFNLVRPGIMLYGCMPAPGMPNPGLTPVLRWETEVAQVKTIPAGTGVSYGQRWIAPRDSRIAVLAVGYADGYSRNMIGQAKVIIRGCVAPVVGTICMDLCVADVTDIPGPAAAGDRVTLIGRDGGAVLTADDLARWSGTISYEVLTRIGPRVPRLVQDG
ncbi:MAG: Alanine racemase [Myxococcota bacterium]|nr:Alanine racemase [Myxococcota bacterium]